MRVNPVTRFRAYLIACCQWQYSRRRLLQKNARQFSDNFLGLHQANVPPAQMSHCSQSVETCHSGGVRDYSEIISLHDTIALLIVILLLA